MLNNVKIVAWNVNSIRSRLMHVISWLELNKPDIVLLQELKCEEHQFPYLELDSLGYNIAIHGQKSYNGVAILSRYPLSDITTIFPGDPDQDQARFIEAVAETPMGIIRLISVYVPNGGEVGSGKYEYKLEFLTHFTKYLRPKLTYDEMMIVGGDYNIALEDIDVYAPKILSDNTCFTMLERVRLRALLNTGFEDAYRLINPNKTEFTWWDYRSNSFAHNKGMRIDHFLVSPLAADNLQKCYIDTAERNKEKASDHAPIIAEFCIS